MKIIFLDIDGVLNHEEHYKNRDFNLEYPLGEFNRGSIELLNKLIENTEAKVVVSSTWRLGRTVEELQDILSKVGFKGEIIDTTPHFGGLRYGSETIISYTIPRGCEIE